VCENCRIWFYWGCDPLSYAQKGMAVNEFRAPRWQTIYTTDARTTTVGDAVLAQRGLPRNGYNRALGFCVLVPPLPPLRPKLYATKSFRSTGTHCAG